MQPQDPMNVPSAIATHGADGKDVVGEDFAEASAAHEADIKTKGGYSIDCNTQGAHMSGPPQSGPATGRFSRTPALACAGPARARDWRLGQHRLAGQRFVDLVRGPSGGSRLVLGSNHQETLGRDCGISLRLPSCNPGRSYYRRGKGQRC